MWRRRGHGSMLEPSLKRPREHGSKACAVGMEVESIAPQRAEAGPLDELYDFCSDYIVIIVDYVHLCGIFWPILTRVSDLL